jgi:hypothetical protein
MLELICQLIQLHERVPDVSKGISVYAGLRVAGRRLRRVHVGRRRRLLAAAAAAA